MWETPYISTDLLRQNLVCITFGQPHVSMPMLDRVVSQRPELVSTIHSFHCEDDPVPRLLRFLDVSWSQEGTVEGKESKIVVPDHLRAVSICCESYIFKEYCIYAISYSILVTSVRFCVVKVFGYFQGMIYSLIYHA